MLQMLARNILAEGKNFKEFPLVLHYTKRDRPDAIALAQLDYYLNSTIKVPRFTTSITKFPGGAEVFESLDAIISLVLFRELRKLVIPKPLEQVECKEKRLSALLYTLKVTPPPCSPCCCSMSLGNWLYLNPNQLARLSVKKSAYWPYSIS
jgi:hypothetical protein